MPLDDDTDISNTQSPQQDELSSPEEDKDEDLDGSEDPTTLDDSEDEP
jgi:hypothetical protein